MLTAPILHHLYSVCGHSDRKIAEFFRLSRSAVREQRHLFGIQTRENIGNTGEQLVMEKMRSFGWEPQDMNEKNKCSSFDILVCGKRIDVKSSGTAFDGVFRFQLSDKAECKVIESDVRIRLSNGRTRKIFRKACDFLVFVCMGEEPLYYIIPAHVIADRMQTIAITPGNKRSKYEPYRNAWWLIKEKSDAPTSDH